MKPINRLLISDLRRMWRQCVAISILLACGVSTFIMSTSTMHSLERSQIRYYSDYNFGDVFVTLTRAPNTLQQRLSDIEGVQRVETRIVQSVILDVPDMHEPATCRLVSVTDNPLHSLNGVSLLRGRWPRRGAESEVIASEPFANAHELRPGDQLDVIMGGRQEQLRIVGIGMSPEFVYAVQPGLILTDDRRFGVLWMPRRQMEAAFNMEGAFNDVVLKLRPKASTQSVIHRVDRLTKSYGGGGAYDRTDQPSHHRVADELHQIGSMAYVTPSIFLAVSAFLFNIVLTRMVHQQQDQIATLRAFGYRRFEIGAYYVKVILFLVAVGTIVGCFAGMRLSWWMTDQYARFFKFPIVEYEFATAEAGFAALVSLLAAGGGSVFAIRRAVTLPPAVAMRPESPKFVKGSLIDRIGLYRLFSPMGRMIIRRLQNNRRTTALSILGMSMGLAVVVLGSFFEDTIDYVLETQFERAQRQDVMVTFYEARSPDSLHDARHMPGVVAAEPFRTVAVRLRNGTREHRLGLMGLESRPRLYRVLDDKNRPIQIPIRPGLTISKKLAEILQVETGDDLTVELLEGRRGTYVLPVAAVFPDYADPGAFLNRHQLHKMLCEGEQHSGVFLLVDPASINEMYAEVKQTPAIAGVLDKNAAMKNFRDTIAENTNVMRTINAAFASIIAFGVIYNCALITLAERSRDLATLRIMGFHRREVSFVLLGELAVITFLAIPIGLPIGCGFAYLATLALDTETHRFPLVISTATLAYSTIVILVAALISALYVRTKLDKLDLIAVMKVKE